MTLPDCPVSADSARLEASRESADDAVGHDREIDSRTLFAGQRRRVIVHQGERYFLQVTRAGKLLLTK